MDIKAVSALGAEALEPLAKALIELPPDQRATALVKAQGAVRTFVEAVQANQPVPDAAEQRDPVVRAVFEMLAKAMPAAPETKPEAKPEISAEDQADHDLQELVKMQTAIAKEKLAKGVLGAMGFGRAAGMRAMMAGARSGKANADRSFRAAQANHAARRDEAYAAATRGMPAGPGRHAAGMAAANRQGRLDGWIPAMTARNRIGAGKRGAEEARRDFQERGARNRRRAAMGAGAAGVGAGGAAYQGRRRRDEEG